MANSLDQNMQQMITSPKKVWKAPEIFLLDRDTTVQAKSLNGVHENNYVGSGYQPKGYSSTPGGYKFYKDATHHWSGLHAHRLNSYNS